MADLSGGLEPVPVSLCPPGAAPPAFQVGLGAAAAPGTAPGRGRDRGGEGGEGEAACGASGSVFAGSGPPRVPLAGGCVFVTGPSAPVRSLFAVRRSDTRTAFEPCVPFRRV